MKENKKKAVQRTARKGIYIPIDGNYSQFKKHLREVETFHMADFPEVGKVG